MQFEFKTQISACKLIQFCFAPFAPVSTLSLILQGGGGGGGGGISSCMQCAFYRFDKMNHTRALLKNIYNPIYLAVFPKFVTSEGVPHAMNMHLRIIAYRCLTKHNYYWGEPKQAPHLGV